MRVGFSTVSVYTNSTKNNRQNVKFTSSNLLPTLSKDALMKLGGTSAEKVEKLGNKIEFLHNLHKNLGDEIKLTAKEHREVGGFEITVSLADEVTPRYYVKPEDRELTIVSSVNADNEEVFHEINRKIVYLQSICGMNV